jgi:putative membrane protein
MKQNFSFKTALKGMGMGMAEVVPGVSGGTIAFVTGIYEQLIDSIKAFDLEFFKLLGRARLKAAYEKVNGSFLVSLFFGMGLGLVIAIFTISWLLLHYPPIIWGFFFGLIIASAIYILRRVDQWNMVEITLLIIATLLAFWIVQSTPASGNEALWFVFLSGMIAICALILPGISGSFILLLMGMYSVIIPSVKNLLKTFDPQYLMITAVFGAGCILGIGIFSRVLSWTFKKYKDQTLAVLSGFMIGSLWKIWPWRNPQSWLNESGELVTSSTATLGLLDMEHVKLLVEANVLPGDYTLGSPHLLWTIVSVVFGFVIVFAFDRLVPDKDLEL